MKKQIAATLGGNEASLVGEKGQPDSCKEEGAVRRLTYRSRRSDEQEFWVDVTYVLVEGVILGFSVEGNDPQVFTAEKPPATD